MSIAHIWFEKQQYALPDNMAHKGSNLRAFFGVPASHHLWRQADVGDDELIEDDAVYTIRERDKFFAANKKINGS